jgi:AcrR family transcriptional regulator
MRRVNKPDATRAKILRAAFKEFYRHGFQGGSLNRIVDEAGTTKGSVFHHFEGKNALGCAVIDELLYEAIKDQWFKPLHASRAIRSPKVSAPLDGEILKLNVRAGEFAAAGLTPEPRLLLGGLEPLHLRVDVDEQDAWRLDPVRKRSRQCVATRLSRRRSPSCASSLTLSRSVP